MPRRITTTWMALTTTTLFLTCAGMAQAEPTDPVVIGWWSYFAEKSEANKVPTTGHADHVVDQFGDPDTYYYEPSGGHGLQEDPAILPPDQAWDTMVSYILAQSDQFTLASEFTRNESSDLNQFAEAYFGWTFAMLYVPKDKYCDTYQVHIGTVDDGVQAMANGKILGYANLGDQNRTIDMVENGTQNLVLRPGINEIVLIHEDQCAVERYVTDVYITHNGNKVPLAPKNILWGRVMDQSSNPIFEATVFLGGPGGEPFETGPLGFWVLRWPGRRFLRSDRTSGGAILRRMRKPTWLLDRPPRRSCASTLRWSWGAIALMVPNAGRTANASSPVYPAAGEFQSSCPDPDEVCVNGYCVSEPCDTMMCDPGFTCEDGACVEVACSNVCCGEGQVCSGGMCVENQCGEGCPAGEVCAGGECVDGCSVLTCVNGLLCKDGVCLPACEVDPSQCSSGESDAGSPLVDSGTGADSGQGSSSGGSGGESSSGYSGGSATDGEDDGGGCGCSVPNHRSRWGALIAVALGLLWARRRRQ